MHSNDSHLTDPKNSDLELSFEERLQSKISCNITSNYSKSPKTNEPLKYDFANISRKNPQSTLNRFENHIQAISVMTLIL